MHIVTKILIVFCAILSLVLAALAIAYSANANALHDAYKNMYVLKIAAEESARNEIAQYGQEKAAATERLQSLQNTNQALASEVSGLQKERTDLRTQLEISKAEATAIQNQIGQFTATTQTQTDLIKNYRDEVTTLRDNLLSAQKREIDLVDRINELESAREVLEQNARALKEQLEETKLALQSAQQNQSSGLPGGGSAATGRAGDAPAREMPGNVVRAQIDDVFTSPAGDAMVVISEGANRGIKENSLMHVIRGSDQFVGSVVVTAVEPGRSVGRFNSYGKKVAAQKGDAVLSRLN